MATARVQTPDGRIITLEVPEGSTEQEILDFVQSQDLSQFNQQPQEQQIEQEPTAAERVLGGISGAATLASDIAGTSAAGLTALVDALNPLTDNDPIQLIEQVRQRLRIEPTERGQAALNELGNVVESSGLGGFLQSVQEFSDKAGKQGLELTGSPAFATFVSMIPDIIAEVGGAGLGGRVARQGANVPAVQQTQRAVQSAIQQADDVTGITRLTSDVFPPESRLGRLMQSQGELVAGFQRKGQQAQRVRAVENIANRYDVIEGVGFENKIVQGLKDSVEQSKRAIGDLYDQSTAQLDRLGSVSLENTKRFAQDVIDRELKKGSRANQTVIDDMQTLIDAPDDMTFELVKEIRSSVGANLEKVNRGAPVQGNADTGLLKRTYANLTKDMQKFADNADPQLAENWRKANESVTEFALGTSKQGAKAIIRQGDATPEVVDRLLFSGKNSDIDFLAENLTPVGKQAAKQRVLQRVMQKSSIDGDDINPNKFLAELNRNRSQISRLFDPDESKAIMALRDQLAKTRRAQEAAVTTPTGQQLTLAAAVALPPSLVPGVVQGIVESKPIRDLIIRRSAAKSPRARTRITQELQDEINRFRLGGALLAAPLTDREGDQ